jgi:hypothetical protein
MALDIKNILRAGTAIQAAGLLGENIKATRRKKKRLVKLAVTNIVGISLLKTQSQLIGGL